MQCMQLLWKRSKYSYFCLTLIRVEHLAKQTFETVCQSTAAVFVLIIISLLEACVCSHIWNYTERYIYGSWHYKQDMGRSGILSGSDSGSDITQIVMPVSCVTPARKSSRCKFGITGILDVLPSKCAGCSLSPMSRQVSWVHTLLGCAEVEILSPNYWDLVPWRMLCHTYVPRCTENLNLEKRRRKNTSL